MVCELDEFKEIYRAENYPALMHNTQNEPETDIMYDLLVVGCINCGCVQMKNIVDANSLYNDGYTTASFSKLAINHNIEFSRFIKDNMNDMEFLEVGANTGALYKLLSIGNSLRYTVLDMFKSASLPEEITFIKGNCEEFSYSGHKTLILSQTFEHLIDPHKFLKSVQAGGVETLFVSIPNFNNQLESGDLNTINAQHTFYCAYEYILYMFSLYNYRCQAFDTYINNSSMFKFTRDSTVCRLNMPLPGYAIKRFEDLYIRTKAEIDNIEVVLPTYIYPAGQIGQLLYENLGSRKKHILGFLDGDKKKDKTRLYGTILQTHYPSKLLEHLSKPVNIVICKCPYQKEILELLEQYKACVQNIKLL